MEGQRAEAPSCLMHYSSGMLAGRQGRPFRLADADHVYFLIENMPKSLALMAQA